MNILVCSSKAFFPYLTVMLASLYENNRGSQLTVFILHSELNAADEALLQEQAKPYGNEIKQLYINDQELAGLPTRQQWPLVLYYRLLVADVLPQTVDRILSLDVDIIVRKSLRTMYEMDLTDCYIAACEDAMINTARYKTRLGMPLHRNYFNAGVMLFHLQKMREDGIGIARFLDTADKQNYQLAVPDQDLLNLVLAEKTKLLEPTSYNCSPLLFEQKQDGHIGRGEQFGSIIHYLRSDGKPWNTHVATLSSDLENIWWSYAEKTSFYSELKQDFEERITNNLVRENLALKQYYDVSLKWLQVENRKKKLEDYFLQRNYQSIAVYGMNAFQEILCRDLEESSVQVRYLIDSYAKGFSYGYEIKNGSHFADVDAIVVAASAHFREIRSSLDDTCPVLSLDEVITAIYRMS